MPRPQPFGPHARVTETRCPDLYNARPGDRVGHATILANSGAKLPGKSGKRSAKSAPPWGRVVSAEPGKVVLAFSLPAKELWSNGDKGAWRKKAKATKDHVAVARNAAEDAIKAAGGGFPWERAEAREVYYWPTCAHRDVRNAEGAMKATWDGLVRGGLLVDDSAAHLAHLPSVFEVDRKNPRIEVTVRRVAV